MTDKLTLKIHDQLSESKMILKNMNHNLLFRPNLTDSIRKDLMYLKSFLEDVQSLLDSESTEVVSTASAESSDLHAVRECNANDKTDESTDAVVAGRLEKRTDSEKVCDRVNRLDCNRCINCGAKAGHDCLL